MNESKIKRLPKSDLILIDGTSVSLKGEYMFSPEDTVYQVGLGVVHVAKALWKSLTFRNYVITVVGRNGSPKHLLVQTDYTDTEMMK